ncbi:MAG: hypothetical protein WBF58_03845, partial [Xanthobacteraceae bacterium]
AAAASVVRSLPTNCLIEFDRALTRPQGSMDARVKPAHDDLRWLRVNDGYPAAMLEITAMDGGK